MSRENIDPDEVEGLLLDARLNPPKGWRKILEQDPEPQLQALLDQGYEVPDKEEIKREIYE